MPKELTELADSELAGGAVLSLDAIAKEKNAVTIIDLQHPSIEGSVPVASVPQGRSLLSVRGFMEEYLDRPLRRRGLATVLSARAFVDLVNRFRGASSAVFADPDPKAPSLTAVFNYHEKGTTEAVDEGTAEPGWCDHRAKLACRMSEEWKAWTSIHAKPLSQQDFAEFLQDRIADCVIVDSAKETPIAEMVEQLQARLGGPIQLMKLARGLEVKQGLAVKNAITLETGELQVSFIETQADANGGPITTPNLFFITIPVFYAGAAYRIAVRLRYRVRGSDVVWSFHLYRADKVFEHAFDELMEKVRADTELPVFVGAQEQ